MKRKFYFSFLAFAVLLTAAFAFVIGRGAGARAASPNSAVSALPASDFVVSIDVQRALSQTLPQILAARPELLAKFNANLKEFEEKTGVSPRVFESVAIGGSLNQATAHDRRDQSSVIVARGNFHSDELLNAAFTAAKKDCEFDREEQQYEGKTIYVISNVRRLKKEGDKDSDPTIKEHYTFHVGVAQSGSDKFAVAAVDGNTIAVGSPESVRATIDASLGRNRIDEEMVRLVTERADAVASFGGRIPAAAFEKLSAQSNGFLASFASIREFYGSFGVTGDEAETFIGLRTETAAQAGEISKTINALKGLAGLGPSGLGKNPSEKQAMNEFLNSLSITSLDNEVRISFKVAQSSLAALMRAL